MFKPGDILVCRYKVGNLSIGDVLVVERLFDYKLNFKNQESNYSILWFIPNFYYQLLDTTQHQFYADVILGRRRIE